MGRRREHPTHATIISTAIDILGVTGALLVAGVFFFVMTAFG
jgi:hypothetical protein